MRRGPSWIAGGLAGVIVVVLMFITIGNWMRIGDVGIGLNGWIALVLGVVVTMAMGVGLMALVFISSRGGYDEPPGR